MASRPAIVGPAPPPLVSRIWQKTLDFLIRKRVRITVILFVLLVAEDVLERHDPHNLANLADWKVVLGLGLVFSGLALRSWAAGTLHKRTEITTSGPYGLVRHPLYIGSFLMMVGFCELIDDAENIYFVFGPMLALYIYRALHEEKNLASIFPSQWSEYAQRVPRFIPRRLPKQLFSTWDFKQWIRNREYQALCAVILGLFALQAWEVFESYF